MHDVTYVGALSLASKGHPQECMIGLLSLNNQDTQVKPFAVPAGITYLSGRPGGGVRRVAREDDITFTNRRHNYYEYI